MTKEDFLAKAMIHVGAALVKVYDEKANGITNNEEQQAQRASNAARIAHRLLREAIERDVDFDDANENYHLREISDHLDYIGDQIGNGDNEDFDEEETTGVHRRCVKLRYDSEKGEIIYSANEVADVEKERGGTPLMHACAKQFCDFRKEHPEVTEVHFFTDELLRDEDYVDE